MAKIIILRGNSGSGKSTVARMLQRQLGRGTLLIPQDVVRRDMLWVRDGEGNAAIPLLIQLVRYGQSHCEYVILEGILDANCYRELFEVIVAEYGENVFAYYYDLPFEETLRRHQTKPNRADFGEADMRSWWKEKDYIGFIPEKTLTAGMSTDEVLSLILKNLAHSSSRSKIDRYAHYANPDTRDEAQLVWYLNL